jgi:hypothetical protein
MPCAIAFAADAPPPAMTTPPTEAMTSIATKSATTGRWRLVTAQALNNIVFSPPWRGSVPSPDAALNQARTQVPRTTGPLSSRSERGLGV